MKLVLCCGCFDVLHIGHVDHLRAARMQGDRLIVALTGDGFIHKGPGRPVFNEYQRASMLRELRCVDEVFIYHDEKPYKVIRSLRPDVYCKGIEYRDNLPERELLESLGCRIVFTNEPTYSSTKLVKEI